MKRHSNRSEQRKQAWSEFRLPIEGYEDRCGPYWEAFLEIWAQCAGFDADFLQRMRKYRKELKAKFDYWKDARREEEDAKRRESERQRKLDEDLRYARPEFEDAVRRFKRSSDCHCDCLEALGLTPPVTEDDIKSAFRRLSKSAHPDVGGSQEKFVALRKNYEKALAYAGRSEP